MVRCCNRNCNPITTQNHSTFYYTTKASARISQGMLHVAISRFIQIVSPDLIFAGIDATGFKNRHATHTIPIDVISGIHLQKCQQDQI